MANTIPMPELPEVETHRRELWSVLQNQPQLRSLRFHRDNLRFSLPKEALRSFVGQRLLRLDRRAKYLLFFFEKGVCLSSLGMTGRWRFGQPDLKHDHVVWEFEGCEPLIFNDPRRFGFLDVENIASFLDKLGPEPLEEDFRPESLFSSLREVKAPIKPVLMDQRWVVGVGNIYASEALFRAGIGPRRPAASLSKKECNRLVESVRFVLREALNSGGSTIRDYLSPSGLSGSFQHQFQVYDREGQPCRRCARPIQRIIQSGRSTFWCPSCQKSAGARAPAGPESSSL